MLPLDRLDLDGKAALLTGAAGGIGQAIARALAGAGCRVVLSDVETTRLEAVQAGLADPERHRLQAADLADPAAMENLVARTEAAFGRLDILVHAGAMLLRQPLAAVTAADVQRTAAVNMVGPFFLARAAGEAMRRAGGGRIVMFTSQGAFTGGYASSTVYAMTKAAIVALTKSLAREYAPQGITVNAVSPGGIDTPMFSAGVDAAVIARFKAMIPMERIGTPDEVALATLFLCSGWSAYVTGLVLDVNGGQLMR